MRRNLVIVRAGDTSLHPRWLDRGEDRSWDLLVNYFGDDPQKYREPGITRIDSKGPKWPALKELITAHRDLIDRYEYVWLPDDDIDCRGRDIDALFAITRRERLALTQPALTVDSYWSHAITLKCPFIQARVTNFVEIMVPCFEHDFLTKCLPTFDANLSGHGVEFLWSRLSQDNGCPMAIIDSISVRHTRPVGAANYKSLEEKGITARDEVRDLISAYGINDLVARVRSVLPAGGLWLSADSFIGKLLLRGAYLTLLTVAYGLRKPYRWGLDKAFRDHLRDPTQFDVGAFYGR